MAVLFRDEHVLAADACLAVPRTGVAVAALLAADDRAWCAAQAIAWGPCRYRTEFRACWNDEALFVRFDATDEAPWSTLTTRDGPLWEEEVVELFVDPVCAGRDYAEIEISPSNVVCDLRVRTPWPRLASDCGWHWDGMVTAVRRRSPGRDDWIATAQLPWTGLASLCSGAVRCVPPRPGDRWGFNVFRIKRPHGPADPERDAVYAAWSVPDAPSFHVPSVFRELVFQP